MCPVIYDPNARLELWDWFLKQATDGDNDLQGFLQRAAGYGLTGSTEREVLFFVYGPAASGKSTFVEAIKRTMGDYARSVSFDAFLERRRSGGNAQPEIARLAGARFVSAIEVKEGVKFATALVNNLVGGDTIATRDMYQRTFEFLPQFKLWLAANNAPRIPDDDDAAWRRMLRLPFNHAVPKAQQRPEVKATLTNVELAGAAVLAWAVRGCLAYQREGLRVPMAVEKSTTQYRQDMDPLTDFLDECCELGANLYVSSAAIWIHYEGYCKKYGERHRLTRTNFGKKLTARGFKCEREYVAGRQTRCWRGLGLKPE